MSRRRRRHNEAAPTQNDPPPNSQAQPQPSERAPGAPPDAVMQRRQSRRKSRSRRLVAGHGGTGTPLPEMEQFGRLHEKISTSLKNLEFTRDFLRAMIDHSRVLNPIVTKYLDKQKKMGLRFSVVDTSIQDYWKNTADYRVQMAAELEDNIVAPIEQFLAQSKAKQKEMYKANAKSRKAFLNAQKEHTKQKAVCEREWGRLDTAIRTNDDLHKRGRNPKPLRKPQEQCSKAFLRMEDLTRNLNKLERDNHGQCCQMARILSQSQHLAAVRLKAHCDTAAYRADVLQSFTAKIHPIVSRKAPTADTIVWTWVSYPKNHHTALPCSARDVLQKTRITQRFEVRAQPDYQNSEFLNPPENAELPPGMRSVNMPQIRGTTPEPAPSATEQKQQQPTIGRENSSVEQEERPKNRRGREGRDGRDGREGGPSQPEHPPEQRNEEPGAASGGFGGDWGDFQQDEWGLEDQKTPGGPPANAPAASQPEQQQAVPPQEAAPPPAAANGFDDQEFGFDDFDAGFDSFDQTPGGGPATEPNPAETSAGPPPQPREVSVSTSAMIVTATANDFDAFGADDDDFGEFDDFDEDFESGFENAFHTPTASIHERVSMSGLNPDDDLTSPFSQPSGFEDDFDTGFDDFDTGFGSSGDVDPPALAPVDNLAPTDPQERRLDSPDPMAGGIVRFDSQSQLSMEETVNSGFDFDGDFTVGDDDGGDPFSSFGQTDAPKAMADNTPEPEPVQDLDDVDPFEQMMAKTATGNRVAVAAAAVASQPVVSMAQPTGGTGFGDDFDTGFDDFDSGFGGFDAPVSTATLQPETRPPVAQPEPVAVSAFDSAAANVTPGGFDDFDSGFDDFDGGFDAPVANSKAKTPEPQPVEPEPEPEPEPEEKENHDLPDDMNDIFAQFAGGLGGNSPPPPMNAPMDLTSLGFGQGFGTDTPKPVPAQPEALAVESNSKPPAAESTSAVAANPFDLLMGGSDASNDPSPLSAAFGAAPDVSAAAQSTSTAEKKPDPAPSNGDGFDDDFSGFDAW